MVITYWYYVGQVVIDLYYYIAARHKHTGSNCDHLW